MRIGGHFYANCRAPSDHPWVICNAKIYSLTLQTEEGRLEAQAEEQMKTPGRLQSTEEISNNREHEINHIDTAFLFNETTSETKIFGHDHQSLF